MGIWKIHVVSLKKVTHQRSAKLILKEAIGNAGTERTFNALRQVQIWNRCSLGAKTVDKLCYVWVNYRFLEDKVLEKLKIRVQK